MNCHNCGLPEKSLDNPGVKIGVILDPDNPFKKKRKSEVWCCTEECGWQAYAISIMGPSTHRWPLKYDEFKRKNRLEFEAMLRAYGNSPVNDRKYEGKNPIKEGQAVVALETKIQRRGRPRKWNSEADRLRAFRGRKRA